LSIPGSGQTSSLYYSDPEYDELSRLVGASEPSGTFGGTQSDDGHASGAGVTITWLIHDVEPWRVDRVYPGRNGEVWISTQVNLGGSIWEAPVVWHQPENGARLAALLDELGLGEETVTDTSVGDVADAPVEQVGPETSTPQTVRDQEAGSTWPANAGWAAGGLVGGAVLALAWTHARRRSDVGSAEEFAVPHDAQGEVLAR
jgi:hypothetical protein